MVAERVFLISKRGKSVSNKFIQCIIQMALLRGEENVKEEV